MLPVISFLLCLCAREGLSNFSSLLCYCITTQGGRYCIVGVWVKDHWWLLGMHHVIRSCCQSHDLVSRSNITMNGLMLNSSIIFTFGFRFETLVDLRSLPNDVHKARKWSYKTALQLSLWVYNMDISPGLISKTCILTIFHLPKTSILCLLFCCPWPLYIHGNSCLLGSTTGNQQWLNRLSSDHNHCGKHMPISVMCWPMRVGIQLRWYPFCIGVQILKWGQHPF